MDIDFCECGGMMVPAGSKARCRSCGREINKKIEAKAVSHAEKKEMLVFENNDLDLAVAVGAAYYSHVKSGGAGVLVRIIGAVGTAILGFAIMILNYAVH